MKFFIETKDIVTQVKTDLLVTLTHDNKINSHPVLDKIDKKLGGEISRISKKEKFDAKMGHYKLLNTHGKIGAEYVLVLGLGDKKDFTLQTLRKVSAKVTSLASQIKASRIAVSINGIHVANHTKAEYAQAFVEGIYLSSYKFTHYLKPEKEAFTISEVHLVCLDARDSAEIKKGVARGELTSKGVCLARDLINTPALDMTPMDLARTAQALKGIRTKIYKTPQIKQLKMGAYLGVAMGSIHPPAFIEMHYRPTGKIKKTIALVGKGVTFDSGGLSLKPPKSMETMKDDMSGAAAVIGLMSVIAQLKPQVEVWGFVAACENMPDAQAQRPGDIVRAMNGKTIEVLNTDAEGRLTLADACSYAIKKKPDYLIDVATLTGACLVALGDRYSGILGNNKELIHRLIECGEKTGEKMWELPLAEEYKTELKSPIADLKNVGGSYGGTINGALFIQEFVGDTKWAHLDIAGPSWADRATDYETKGGTGVMVRTFIEFLMSQ